MFSDLTYISLWWSIYFVLGAVTLPLTFVLFKKFNDRGYVFSKILSLGLITYLMFVAGVFKLLPFTSSTLLIIIVGLILSMVYYLKKADNYQQFISVINTHWKIFLFEEFAFFSILLTWSYVRGFAPDIEGLEKFMDWGFVNSALRTQFMPPQDMWFAGSSINYYYFGHLIVAVLTKLSNIDSAITYNLAIASTCALTFVSALSLSSNIIFTSFSKLSKNTVLIGGIFSALILTFGGNLHPVYKILKLNLEQNVNHFVFTKKALSTAANAYWYPDATRFIGFDPDVKDKTIHEFPLYSFVVADLHGHMNDIPVVLFFLAFIFSLSQVSKTSRFNWPLVIGSGLTLSVAYMTNAWDFAVYGLVFAIYSFISQKSKSTLSESIINTIKHGLAVIVCWYVFTLPFSLNFTPMAEGLRLSDSHTPFYQLFILYGGFWLICLPFVFSVIRQRFSGLNTSDLFVLALIITATMLIIIPEIGYIKDIYIYEHRRANTMFKLVYQAFILYSVVSGYILIRLRHRFSYRLLFGVVMAIHLIYPYFAIKSFYGLKEYKGLWGANFLRVNYPSNFEAIAWLNKNIEGQPVILEATGDSYTTFNQVSIATGLPTVEGWVVHEWLWRGGYDKPSARQTDVTNIYEALDPKVASSLLQKYSVKYIFVGDKEREKYPKLNEKIFETIGAKIVFESGNTRVYKL